MRKEKLYTAAIYFTKGLEDIVVEEIRDLDTGVEIIEETNRFVLISGLLDEIMRFGKAARTVDDLRLVLSGPKIVTTPKEFNLFFEQTYISLRKILEEISDARDLNSSISLTVSVKNPIWKKKPRWDPNSIVNTYLPQLDLNSKERKGVDIRLQVDGDSMHTSINVFHTPIGKRGKEYIWPGRLRPSVAAAMVRIAVKKAKDTNHSPTLYDPFCGSGTILEEGAYMGWNIFGSDMDPSAIEIARKRMNSVQSRLNVNFNLMHRIFVHDIEQGMPTRVITDMLVSNLPWGKQVDISKHKMLYTNISELAREVISLDGVCVLLTSDVERLVAVIKSRNLDVSIGTREIGLLGQNPSIICLSKERT